MAAVSPTCTARYTRSIPVSPQPSGRVERHAAERLNAVDRRDVRHLVQARADADGVERHRLRRVRVRPIRRTRRVRLGRASLHAVD
eukprot:3143447-Prymnesium_polylepis.1